MFWTKLEDRHPTEKDLPFITYGVKLSFFPKSNLYNDFHETWNDMDWFYELTDEERDEWVFWMKLEFPKPEKDA